MFLIWLLAIELNGGGIENWILRAKPEDGPQARDSLVKDRFSVIQRRLPRVPTAFWNDSVTDEIVGSYSALTKTIACRDQFRPLQTKLRTWSLLGLLLTLVALRIEPVCAEEAVDNWAEFRKRLAACWQAPSGTEGSLIAFLFGLDKTGALRGEPLVTARRFTGDANAQRQFEEAATRTLETCLPMRVTPGFGAILGESPIRLRLVNTKPTTAYQINSNITIFAPQP